LGAVADYPHPSSAGRSANMRANRRTDTKPELALRRALHSRGYRYRKDYRLDLDGGKRVRPDIAFTARRVAVFVDGCFWHCCPEHGSKPAVNVGYWDPKLRRNVERDRAADTALLAAGWAVVRVWEHESIETAVAAVLAALGSSPAALGAALNRSPVALGGTPAALNRSPAALNRSPAALGSSPAALGSSPAALGRSKSDSPAPAP
jgi:DNA mismatch endonuclease, patch repair protein